ncbi:MAG: signal peptidase I, partial [Angustibacter sp.]
TVGLLPADSNDHLIKRIIGMPGDRVKCCAKDGRITINGVPIDEPYVYQGNQPSMTEFDITVPPGRVWVMGDHRSDSGDSRVHDEGSGGKVGSVPMDSITGKAFALVWPISNITWLGRPEETFKAVDEASGGNRQPAPAASSGP